MSYYLQIVYLSFIIPFLFYEYFIIFASEFDQPDYNHILYGGVWKHIVLEPSQNADDVKLANEVSLKLISSQYFGSVLQKLTVACVTKADLWYSESGYTPFVFTELIANHRGHEYPFSVPVSFGITYNIEVTIATNDSVTIHFVTLTKSLEHKQFFVYSHSFRAACYNDIDMEIRRRYSLLHQSNKDRINMTILSPLSKDKLLLVNPSKDNIALATADMHRTEEDADVAKDKNCSRLKQEKSYLECKKSNKKDCANFTVMTFNIWNFNTYQKESQHYPTRMEALGKLLKKANPDIVAFQEVRFEAPLGEHLGPSQMDFLISQLPGYQFVYQPAQLHGSSFNQGRTEEGVAIFSKFPIIHHDYLLLFRNHSNSADGHQRVCLHVVIDLPCIGKGHIFNTHLSLSHEAREESMKQIIKFMSPLGTEPAIFVGDLNATPEENAIKLLTQNIGFTDVWALLHPSEEGLTFSAIDELTKRIDYIFMKKSKDINAESIEIIPDYSRSRAASDHRALQASFRILNCNN